MKDIETLEVRKLARSIMAERCPDLMGREYETMYGHAISCAILTLLGKDVGFNHLCR